MEKNPFDGKCHICGKAGIPDLDALADHIIGEGHKKGRHWALLYKQRRVRNKRDKSRGDRNPVTQEQKDNLACTQRELSGKTEQVKAVCLPGKHATLQFLPIEFTQSEQAHRINGLLVVNCNSHTRRK